MVMMSDLVQRLRRVPVYTDLLKEAADRIELLEVSEAGEITKLRDRIEALSAALDAAIHLINTKNNMESGDRVSEAERAFYTALVPLMEAKR